MIRKCCVCEKVLSPIEVGGNAGEILVMLDFCEEHRPAPEPDIEDEFDETTRKVLAMDIYDAQGNLVPKVVILQTASGYEDVTAKYLEGACGD